MTARGDLRLILIRHGQTPSNVAGLLDTRIPGPGLTDLGREQAEALVGTLRNEPIDSITVSTMRRTADTAAPLLADRGLTARVRDGAREVTSGDMEMLSDERSVRTYLETVIAWAGGDLDVRIPGGEDGHEAFARFGAVVDELADSDDRVSVIVSHGAMIRSWATWAAGGLDVVEMARRPLANTGVVVLEGLPGSWRAVSWAGEPVSALAEPVEQSGPAGPPPEDELD